MRQKIDLQKKKNFSPFIPFFIVVVMIVSLFSIIDSNNTANRTKYKGVLFVQNIEKQTWELEQNGYTYTFHYLPTELSIKVPAHSLMYDSYYLVENPSANYSQEDLSLIGLAKFEAKENLNKKGFSTTSGFSIEYNSILAITCANASEQIGVILFQLGNETKIINENNCILVEGPSGIEIIKAKDKLMYVIFGIE